MHDRDAVPLAPPHVVQGLKQGSLRRWFEVLLYKETIDNSVSQLNELMVAIDKVKIKSENGKEYISKVKGMVALLLKTKDDKSPKYIIKIRTEIIIVYQEIIDSQDLVYEDQMAILSQLMLLLNLLNKSSPMSFWFSGRTSHDLSASNSFAALLA